MSESLETQTLQERLERLRELTEFTENCKKQLDGLLETLGWSMVCNQEQMEQCPYDPHHRVPVRSMEKHKASCRLRKMGYSAEEEAEMIDPSVCHENTNIKSLIMDKHTQHQVILQARSAAPLMRMEGVFWQGQYSGQPVDVPQSHKRAVCDLTVADRLALYDHVISVFSRQNEAAASSNDDLYVDLVSKLQKDEEQNEPKTHLELMAEMRDYKRRRQSYRAKNVHITKKSYTEVIREVINVHSEELCRQWTEEDEEEEGERPEPSSHRRRSMERRSTERRSMERRSMERRSMERRSMERRSTERRSAEHRSTERRSAERRSAERRSTERWSSESRHSRRHRSRERSHERERESKKKKKRSRDSRSPDDDYHHHHERKKKKKKKKDDREKEK